MDGGPLDPSQDGRLGLAWRTTVHLRPRRRVRALRQRHQRDRPLRVQLRRQLPGLAAGPRPGRDPLVLVRAAPRQRRAGQRRREPIAALGFSSWPTRAEAEQAAVPWDACVDAFDFGLPQVCTPAQRQLLVREGSPVVDDMAGKPIHVATFPDADPSWVDSARLGVAEHAGASAFSVEQSSFGTWRRQLGALGEGRQELPPPAAPLPVRPVEPRPEPAEPGPEARETLTPVQFDEPGELALLAHRILAVVQARIDAGGKLTDDDLVGEIEHVLRD